MTKEKKILNRSIYLSKELENDLKKIAEEEGYNFSLLIRRVLKKFVSDRTK